MIIRESGLFFGPPYINLHRHNCHEMFSFTLTNLVRPCKKLNF